MSKKQAPKLNPYESKVLWHRAFELFCQGRTHEEIANHPEIPYAFHTVRRKSQDEDWVEKRKKIIDKEDNRQTALAEVVENELADLINLKDELWKNWTPKTKMCVARAVALGKPLTSVMRLYGFDTQSTDQYMKSDGEFRDMINSAIREYEVVLLEEIRNAKDWKAKAWLLERHHALRDEYKQEEKGGGLQITVNFERTPIDVGNIIEGEVVEERIVRLEDVKEAPQVPTVEVMKPKAPTRQEILDRARGRTEDHNAKLLEKIAAQQERGPEGTGTDGS